MAHHQNTISEFIGAMLFFGTILAMIIWVTILYMQEEHQSGMRAQKGETIHRAIEDGVVWYDKKGNLVYSGNLKFVLTGEKE
jgi:hypothetical protein